MQIVCVSRGTYSGGKELSEKLAAKLGYDCVAREELTDAASVAGIPVGKLEMAMVRRRPLSESLAVEKERFKAFVTATICERALKSSLVYHGRIGQFVLPGVSHILRVRAIMDEHGRTAATMARLNLDREKARKFNQQVDDDVRRWVRVMYNVDWDDPAYYDLVVNFSHLNVDNAAAGLVTMAQMPEFQATPASQQVLTDLDLASRSRLALGADSRTHDMNVQVRADRGRVSVTYRPQDERSAQVIPDILKNIDGIGEVVCTMATTNLLWIQERFDPAGDSLNQVLEIAGKWNAAVQIVRLSEGGEDQEEEEEEESVEPSSEAPVVSPEEHGGILDDAPDTGEIQDEGLKETMGRLVAAGCSGGSRLVRGGAQRLLHGIDRSVPYSLVVVGDVFLSKGESVRKRQARDLITYLADNLRVPVIGNDELKTQYLFRARDWLSLAIYGAITLALFFLVFTHQAEVSGFLSGDSYRPLAVPCLFVFVPFFAYNYGNFWRLVLKLFKFE
jgi:cytidylate kinase